ncbi:sensor histidine kinase [Agathobacter sp.]
MRDDLKRVKQKLSWTFAIAIIGTCAVFGILYYLGIDWLNFYIEGSSLLIYDNEKPYVDEFQQYVTDNDVSTTDIEQYDEWMADHDVSFYSIEKEGKIVYSKSNVDKLIAPAKNMYDYRMAGSYQISVNFSDTDAYVFIYTGFTEKYYIAFMFFDVGFSLMMGIVFVYLRIRKIIAGYQTELEETQSREKKARQEKDELMRNMAHDLRTPLTGLMTYIDIMKIENEADEENQKYLDIVTDKVMNIKTQMDNLLDFSMASSEKNIELDKPIEAEYAVGDYLSEMYAVLRDKGYTIDIEKIKWEKQNIAVNIGLISRVFTNLTDNICKYADMDKTVVMETSFSKNDFKVKIGNGICDDKTLLESTGIGLKSVDMMMLRMNGSMSYSREHGMFWVKLEFPIVK